MTPERLVWVVTDQGSNNEALLACLRPFAREFGDVVLRHVYVAKSDLVRPKVHKVLQTVQAEQRKWRQARTRDPVLVFRDSECRADNELVAARMHVSAVVAGLQQVFPNAWGWAFNPMSEGAFLLFDEAVAALLARTKEEVTLRRLVTQKRAGTLVNKDLLEDTLGVADSRRKRALDEEMASLLFGETPVACADPQYTRALEQIRRVLEAGLRPDQGTNAAGGSAPE